MNSINFEIYSLIITLILLLDYHLKFKNSFTNNSKILKKFLLGVISLALVNLLMIVSINLEMLRLILLIIAFIIIFYLPVILYDYFKDKYLKYIFNTNKNIFVRKIYYGLCLILITFVFYYNKDRIVPGYITEAGYYSRFLIVSIIPLLVLLFRYIYLRIFKDQIRNIRLFLIIIIAITGIILEIFVLNSTSILTLTYLICGLLLYSNNHEEIMNRDKLTGVYNRVVLERFQNDKRGVGKVSAVYMIDIDKFKSINDTYGHNKGDKVLIDVAKILTTSVRQSDYIIRYGGDEFLIIAKINDIISLNVIPEKIKKNLDLYNSKHKIQIGLSIGSSIYNPDKNNLNKMLTKADQKMYKNKNRIN